MAVWKKIRAAVIIVLPVLKQGVIWISLWSGLATYTIC